MQPAYVRLVVLCGDRPKAELVRMLMVALNGVRPAQHDEGCAEPAFYIEGSILQWGEEIKICLALACMRTHVILATERHLYRRSLSHETIARDAADHLWSRIEARSAWSLI